MKNKRSRWVLDTLEKQIFAILAFTLVAVLIGAMIYQFSQHRNVEQEAASDQTVNAIRVRLPILERIKPEELQDFVATTSICHKGFSVSEAPFGAHSNTVNTDSIRAFIAEKLRRAQEDIVVSYADFSGDNFAYGQCAPGEFDFPVAGIVVSARMVSGQWLNVEVHAHKFELIGDQLVSILRITLFLFLVGAAALFFIGRLTRPLSKLTAAASSFGSDLRVEEVEETGPIDIRQAIRSFNTMQREVRDEIKRRTHMLAAVGHDIRTPLTGLRVKAEFIEDAEIRNDIIKSIQKMERITESALDYVRGESRSEPKQNVDLRALIESECSEFEELGETVTFSEDQPVHYRCRPVALGRAIRNLVDNAVKYGGGATVELLSGNGNIHIRVIDDGPGISDHRKLEAFAPFTRLSQARESEKGGFGLGLSIAKAIVEGHDGALSLESNKPRGLIAVIELPQHPKDGL
ncbi:MAG: ATP-binding protein [Woeseiaceae bacterium]